MCNKVTMHPREIGMVEGMLWSKGGIMNQRETKSTNKGNKEHVSEMGKYARDGEKHTTEQQSKRGRGKVKKKEKCKKPEKTR